MQDGEHQEEEKPAAEEEETEEEKVLKKVCGRTWLSSGWFRSKW